MAKSYDTITVTDTSALAPSMGVLEVYSGSGQLKTLLKEVRADGNVMNVRPLKWYETAWYHTQKAFGRIVRLFRRLRPTLVRDWQASDVVVGYDPKTREVVYSSEKTNRSVRYPI